MNKASQDRKNREIGANLFIGSLDPEVDEKLLYDTFSAFGGILSTPKVPSCDVIFAFVGLPLPISSVVI